MSLKGSISAAALALFMTPAFAQAPVKIGMITTLSGPGGYLGQDVRDAFNLAIELEGGKLGGAPVQVIVEDDALKPGQGKEIAERPAVKPQASFRHFILRKFRIPVALSLPVAPFPNYPSSVGEIPTPLRKPFAGAGN